MQAIRVLNTADVIFMADPGEGQPELADLCREVCERYITGRGYRIVTDARALDRYREAVDLAYAYSVPLADFTAAAAA